MERRKMISYLIKRDINEDNVLLIEIYDYFNFFYLMFKYIQC